MLRGKELGYHLDGRDNVLEALHGPEQGTWYDKERGEFVTGKPEPKPQEMPYRTYDEMPAFYWK